MDELVRRVREELVEQGHGRLIHLVSEKEVESALAKLTKRNQQIVKSRILFGNTLSYVGELYCISPSRVKDVCTLFFNNVRYNVNVREYWLCKESTFALFDSVTIKTPLRSIKDLFTAKAFIDLLRLRIYTVQELFDLVDSGKVDTHRFLNSGVCTGAEIKAITNWLKQRLEGIGE